MIPELLLLNDFLFVFSFFLFFLFFLVIFLGEDRFRWGDVSVVDIFGKGKIIMGLSDGECGLGN